MNGFRDLTLMGVQVRNSQKMFVFAFFELQLILRMILFSYTMHMV